MKTADLLSRVSDQRHLTWVGFETDTIFNHGIDLPEFAAFPLMETTEGRALLCRSMEMQSNTAGNHGLGVIVEAPTWIANADRAAPLGYSAADLVDVNREAVALCRQTVPDAIISLNVGPRGDGYEAGTMSIAQSQDYHSAQIAAGSAADLVSGYTLASAKEAAGIALASAAQGLPCVISLTVETDGKLADGTSLSNAIAEIDAATGHGPAYYMVNCAHPDHFGDALDSDRIKGVVVNSSRQSHAELDNATELDAGDPCELARQVAALAHLHPNLRVFGGCCGTDARHLDQMGKALA